MTMTILPSIDARIEFTSGDRAGCQGIVTKRSDKFFIVSLTYAPPKAVDYAKEDLIRVVGTTGYRILPT